MSFLFSAFLGVAALIGLPLLLHLLRLQPRTQIAYPSLRFLGRDALRDARRHHVRRWLTFLFRCLIILLVVGAFSRPYWPLEHTTTSRAVVVVLDNSYSMQAAERIDAMQVWLEPQIAGLRAPDQLGVIVLRPTPEWLAPLSPDLEAGRRALTAFPTSYETSHFRDGLELAATALTLVPTNRKEIVLAADQQRSGWSDVRFDRALPPGVELTTAPVPAAPKRQAAITRLHASRNKEGTLALEAAVMDYTPAEKNRSVTFFLGDSPLGTVACRSGGGQSQILRAEYTVPSLDEALMVRATLDADDLPVDDLAYAVLPAVRDRRAMLAPPSSNASVDFLELALKASQEGTLPAFRMGPLPATGSPWPPSSVAVLRGPAPFRDDALRALDAFLIAGGSAWIICDGSPEQTAWLAARGVKLTPVHPAAVQGLKLRDLTLDHRLFSPFESHSIAPLLAPTFRRGWSLSGSAVEPIARWTDRTVAIGEVSTGMGKLLIAGFGQTREDSVFPIGAAYVPFVHQAVMWLSENELVSDGGRVGEMLALPGSGTWRPLLSPVMGAAIRVNGSVTASAPGIYEFEEGGARRRYAINLNTAESDLTPWPTTSDFASLVSKEPLPKPDASSKGEARPAFDERLVDERGAWWWLIAGVIVLLFLELALANRTIP